VLWARVKEATKRAKRKWRVGDLLVDERYSPTLLDFLRSTHVGRAAPPVEGNWDSGDEEEEAVEVGRRGGGEADGAEERAECPRTPGIGFLCAPLCPVTLLSLVLSLVRLISFETKILGTRLLPLSPTFGAGRQTGKG